MTIEKRMEKLGLLQKAVSQMETEETRADEAMSTGQDGFGQDFVPSDLASTVMENVRNANTFVSRLSAPIVMPTSIYTIPVEGGDPTWIATSENANVTGTAVTPSKAGTSDVTLVSKKYSTSIYMSGELDEDSIVNMNTYLGDKLTKSFAEIVDSIRYNGDVVTAGTGNVNSDDAAPAAWSYYLHQDGLVKKFIESSIDAGALDLADIRAARAELWVKGTRMSDLALVVSVKTYFKLLSLTQVETLEKFGASATIVNGELKAIDGIEVIPSSLLGDAEADGKVSATPSNNTKGRAILVYKPELIHGFKRGLSLYPEYLPEYDQFRMTAHFRYAINVKDSASGVLLRNITI